MNAWTWVLIAYFVANALGSVALIGRDRDPISPGVAVFCLFLYAGLTLILLFAVGVL